MLSDFCFWEVTFKIYRRNHNDGIACRVLILLAWGHPVQSLAPTYVPPSPSGVIFEHIVRKE